MVLTATNHVEIITSVNRAMDGALAVGELDLQRLAKNAKCASLRL
jgi:hypothetical protein